MSKEKIYSAGKLRGSKLLYPDGQIGVGIWYPFSVLLDDHADDDDSNGISFELDLRDLEDAVTLLTRLRDVEAQKIEDFEMDEDDD